MQMQSSTLLLFVFPMLLWLWKSHFCKTFAVGKKKSTVQAIQVIVLDAAQFTAFSNSRACNTK